MTARFTFHIPVVFCLSFASALFGQLDSYQLRAKYGAPIARETFTIAPGFQIVVDYGPDEQVCRLELPPVALSLDQPGVSTQRRVDEFLLELVPPSMRGKQLRSWSAQMGINGVTTTEYEHVVVSEPYSGNQPGRTGVNVVFTRDECSASLDPGNH